jgi:5-methylcytosine-specific restriction endonuclease McrA
MTSAQQMIALTKEEQIEIAWAQHLLFLSQRRSLLTPTLRDQLSEQQKWCCCYCGICMDALRVTTRPPRRFEHIVPRSGVASVSAQWP